MRVIKFPNVAEATVARRKSHRKIEESCIALGRPWDKQMTERRDASNATHGREESTASELLGSSLDVPHLSFLLLSPSRAARSLFFARRKREQRAVREERTRWCWKPSKRAAIFKAYAKSAALLSGSLRGRERGAKSLGQWRLAFGCPESDSRRFMRPRRRRRSSSSRSPLSSSSSFSPRLRILLLRSARSDLPVRSASSRPALEKEREREARILSTRMPGHSRKARNARSARISPSNSLRSSP